MLLHEARPVVQVPEGAGAAAQGDHTCRSAWRPQYPATGMFALLHSILGNTFEKGDTHAQIAPLALPGALLS